MYDCVIVGGGPAGLTAALYMARFKLRCRIVDAGRGRAFQIPRSRNLPGFPNGIPGSELLDKMRAQLKHYEVFATAGRVDQINFTEDHFQVRLAGGNLIARTVLLATGVEDVRPVFADESDHDRALQDGILHYCPVCDGFEVSDRDIIVLGSGAHGTNEALFLRSFTERVTLICPDGPHHLSAQDAQRLARAGVEKANGPISPLELAEGHLLFSRAGTIYRSAAVYAALGCRPRTQLGEDLRIARSEKGTILVDAHQRTSHPSVYAAGDVTRGLDQLVTAIGQGAVAATAIRNDLSDWQ